jgi:hypothetical protein
VYSFAQNDSTKVVSKPKKFDNEINVKKSTDKLKAKPATTKSTPNSNLDFKIDNKPNTSAINKNLNQNKSTNNQNFLMETLPEDRDIIGLKYWKGKDVTHNKLESHLSLGTIRSTSKIVKIECRDHSYIDGDRIRIFLNEKIISTNIGLKGNYYVVYVNLEPGYNRIDFQALNQGLSGPNTAELNVYDDKGTLISSKDWNLPTGYIATLGIIQKQ